MYFWKTKWNICVKSENNPCNRSCLADFEPCWRGAEAMEAINNTTYKLQPSGSFREIISF